MKLLSKFSNNLDQEWMLDFYSQTPCTLNGGIGSKHSLINKDVKFLVY